MSSTESSSSNKRLVYGAEGVQTKVTDIPKKIPKDHVMVRVHAAGLNPVDAKQVIGDKFPAFMDKYTSRMVRGLTVGMEFSGTVVLDKSDSYATGAKVFGSMPPLDGTLSEYIVAPKHHICSMPSNLSFRQAACLPLVGLTALQALQPYSKESKSILIVGASGGTGHVALQVSKAMGFTTRIAVCSTRNIDLCKDLGATHVIDYTKDDLVKELKDKHSGTVDMVFDCVTSVDERDARHAYPKKLLPFCKVKYIRLGGATIDWFYAGCERVIPGVTCFYKTDKLFWIRFPKTADELAILADWSKEGKLMPHIDDNPPVEFSAEAVQQAFDALLERRVTGKLFVEIIKEE